MHFKEHAIVSLKIIEKTSASGLWLVKYIFLFLGGGTALQIVDYGDCLTLNLKKPT